MTCSRSHRIATRLQQFAAAFFLVGILPAIFSNAAQANFMIPVTRVECIPEFGIVTISEGMIRGRRAARSFEDHPDEMAAKYGYYELSSYFIFEGEDEDPPNPRIVGSRTKTIDCQLTDHHVSIVFEPYIARPCPSAVSIRLTVQIDGVLIVEDLEYQRSCLYQDIVSLFKFNEDGEIIFFEGGFDDHRKDELGAHFVKEFAFTLRLNYFKPDQSGQDPLRPLRTFEDVVEVYKLIQ